MNRIYLDYSATTPLAPEVFAAMEPFYKQNFGNASSIHGFGREAKVAIDAARESVAKFLGALPQEIVFTSGGTEANNTALFGVAQNFSTPGHMITSRVEHPSVLQTFGELEARGWSVSYLDTDDTGMVSVEAVEKAIRRETVLLSIMHANNEVGTINPIADLAALAHTRGVLFHTDAVQSAGKLDLDMKAWPASLLSLSGHKIYGPKGVGVLYVRRGVRIKTLMHGGKQERERRPGTENVAAIAGLGKAVTLREKERTEEAKRLHALRKMFVAGVRAIYPAAHLNGSMENSLPGVVNISFPGKDGLALVMSLDLQGIAVSNGSACSSGSVEPSHVLRAMRLDHARANSAVRFSFGKYTTQAEIATTLQALEKILLGKRAYARRGNEALN